MRVKAPRLRKDWGESESVEASPGLLSTELFFNGIFATTLGVVGQTLVDGDPLMALLKFEAFYHVWEASALYATRFNDDDGFHTVWWSAFGTCTMTMLAGCRLSMDAAMWWLLPAATGVAKACLAGANARAGASLPRCRGFAVWIGVQHSMQSLLFFWTAAAPSTGLWAVANAFGIAADGAFLWASEVYPDLDLPLSVAYHAHKYAGFTMLVLGSAVGLVSFATTTQIVAADHVLSSGACNFCALVFALAFKFIAVDSAPKTDLHALHSSSRARRVTWLLIQRLVVAAVVTAGAGAEILVAAWTYDRNGARYFCWSAAFLFALLPVLEALNLAEGTTTLDRKSASLAAALLAVVPFFRPSPLVASYLVALASLALVANVTTTEKEEPASHYDPIPDPTPNQPVDPDRHQELLSFVEAVFDHDDAAPTTRKIDYADPPNVPHNSPAKMPSTTSSHSASNELPAQLLAAHAALRHVPSTSNVSDDASSGTDD